MSNIDPAIANSLMKHGYRHGNILGKGGFGVCLLVRSLKYDQKFACKVMRLNCCAEKKTNDAIRWSYENEIKALLGCFHRNIINIYENWEEDDFLFIILQYCECMSLDKFLPATKMPSEQILRISKEICEAMIYLHSRGICHHDIKPQNILVTNGGTVKIIDFGTSRIYGSRSESETMRAGTKYFMSVDKLSKEKYNPFMADVWAFGVTLHIMLLGKHPFELVSSSHLVDIQRNWYLIDKRNSNSIEKEIACIIRNCLTDDPKKRPTFEKILEDISAIIRKQRKSLPPPQTTKPPRKVLNQVIRQILKP